MRRHVALELARVEGAGRCHEVVERSLGVDPQHDRRVAELQVEVDEQHALIRPRCERRGNVGREHRLAGATLRREHGDDASVGALVAVARIPAGTLACLVDRKRQLLDRLREDKHVVDAGGERRIDDLGVELRASSSTGTRP